MSRPIVKIANVETGEEIEREMNDAEFEQYEKDQIAFAKAQEDKRAKELAREALLERLGISEEEARLILG
jgi:hypothetical protein